MIPTNPKVTYQEYTALHRYEYCLLFYVGTGKPLTTTPGKVKEKTICKSMKPQYMATV